MNFAIAVTVLVVPWLRLDLDTASFSVDAVNIALILIVSFTLHAFNVPLIRFFEGYGLMRFSLGRSLQQRKLTQFQSMKAQTLHFEYDLYQDFPIRPEHVLPTRFGNIIAAIEEYPYRHYGVDTVIMWPRLIPLLKETDYYSAIAKEKATLDFLLNTCVVVTAIGLMFFFLGTYTGHLFAAGMSVILTVMIALLLYNGMIGAARKWGVTIGVAFDLYRKNLFDRLNWELSNFALSTKERTVTSTTQDEGFIPERYVDFDLNIAPGGHTTAKSIQGEASAFISTELSNTIQLALNSIEKCHTNADLLKQLGQEFYNWIFPGDIHAHLEKTEAVARMNNAKLRLRLRIEAESIAKLPLELTYRTVGGYYLAVNPNTVFCRYLNLPMPPGWVRRRQGPLHMLAIIADPTDQIRLNPDEWEALLKEALAEPLAQGNMTLETVKRATRKEVRNALLKQKPDILQFIGHGIYQGGQGYLALVREDTGKTWLVSDELFANLYLGYDDHLGLISLATCESAKSDDPQGFIGIAPQLVQRGIPAVVAMHYRVHIKTAKIFLEDLYTSVAARKPIDWATQQARNAISQELGLDNREFASPVLYMRAQDGNIF